jgi:hypothetical protein
VAALVNYDPAAAGPCPSKSSTQGWNSYILTIIGILSNGKILACTFISKPFGYHGTAAGFTSLYSQ